MIKSDKESSSTAGDIMSQTVVAVKENQDAWSAIGLLISYGITGAPVLDAEGSLVGVISQTDLMRYLQTRAAKLVDFYSDSEPDSRLQTGYCGALVRDLMTPRIIQADEGDSLDKLSRIMLIQKVHRVIITRGQKLVGIVTTMDILRARQGFGGQRASLRP